MRGGFTQQPGNGVGAQVLHGLLEAGRSLHTQPVSQRTPLINRLLHPVAPQNGDSQPTQEYDDEQSRERETLFVPHAGIVARSSVESEAGMLVRCTALGTPLLFNLVTLIRWNMV